MSTLRLPRLHHRESHEHPWLRAVTGLFWSAAGALVLLFVFFAAMGAFDPVEAAGVTVAFAALGMLWLVHAWPSLRGRGR